MKNFFTILILLITLSSCNFLSKKPQKAKDFYETIYDWDITYIPIFPGFRAHSLYKNEWNIEYSNGTIQLGENSFGFIEVETFGVSKNYIYGTISSNDSLNEDKWFLFDTDNVIYVEYNSESELLNTLKKYQLELNAIKSCQDYSIQLAEGERCYWFPAKDENYPEFDKYLPDSFVEIIVTGDENGIDFKLKEDIVRLESKIYYFRLKFDYEDNELFYISINHSYPILIENDLIVVGQTWDDNFDLAVYTPYPVGQEKGVKEEDRIVISKNFQLRH